MKSKTSLVSRTRSKGFTIPAIKKIKSALRLKSKVFLIDLIISMFTKLPKKQKISILIRIDKVKSRVKSKVKRRKSTKRKATKKKTKAQIKATRLRNLKKARAARKRR